MVKPNLRNLHKVTFLKDNVSKKKLSSKSYEKSTKDGQKEKLPTIYILVPANLTNFWVFHVWGKPFSDNFCQIHYL